MPSSNPSVSSPVKCHAMPSKIAPFSIAISSKISARNCLACRSSISTNCGETPASSGNRRNIPPQNEWIVWIFSPPGVSNARANNVRASRNWSASRLTSPSVSNSARSSASAFIAHAPRLPKRRFCISAAAAFVYVKHKIFCGGHPANNNRATRLVSTRVLPEPAFADTQVEFTGIAA